jgi:hypothetical protein
MARLEVFEPEYLHHPSCICQQVKEEERAG